MDLTSPLIDLNAVAHNARAGTAERAARALQGQNSQAVRQAAENFEAVYLSQMLAPMFESLKSDGWFGAGPGEDIYRSMMVEEYGKAIARSGGLGIADNVERELLRLQEAVKP